MYKSHVFDRVSSPKAKVSSIQNGKSLTYETTAHLKSTF